MTLLCWSLCLLCQTGGFPTITHFNKYIDYRYIHFKKTEIYFFLRLYIYKALWVDQIFLWTVINDPSWQLNWIFMAPVTAVARAFMLLVACPSKSGEHDISWMALMYFSHIWLRWSLGLKSGLNRFWWSKSKVTVISSLPLVKGISKTPAECSLQMTLHLAKMCTWTHGQTDF